MENIELYDFEKRLESQLNEIRNDKNIRERNKELIIKFIKSHKAEVTACRSNKIAYLLHKIGEFAVKDFDESGTDDFREITITINSAKCTKRKGKPKAWSEWYRADARAALKIFVRWILVSKCKDDDAKAKVLRDFEFNYKWLKTTIPKNTKKSRVQEGQILDMKEIEDMIKCANGARDKALIALAYESGARPSELLTLRICHIKFNHNGTAIVYIQQSKTDPRPLVLVNSVPYLKAWINTHQKRADNNAPLWIMDSYMRKDKKGKSHLIVPKLPDNPEPMGIERYGKLIQATAKRAGIKKNVFPYLLRHTRITHWLMKYPEPIVKKLSGHSPTSKQFAVYQHITDNDVQNIILKEHGLLNDRQETETELEKSLQCWNCKEMNVADAKFCEHCNFSLDFSNMASTMELVKKIQPALNQLLKMQNMSDSELKRLQVLRDTQLKQAVLKTNG